MAQNNPSKLNALMKKHDWTEAKVAEMLGYAPSTHKTWHGKNMTVHRMLNVPGYEPRMGWKNVFILLQSNVK